MRNFVMLLILGFNIVADLSRTTNEQSLYQPAFAVVLADYLNQDVYADINAHLVDIDGQGTVGMLLWQHPPRGNSLPRLYYVSDDHVFSRAIDPNFFLSSYGRLVVAGENSGGVTTIFFGIEEGRVVDEFFLSWIRRPSDWYDSDVWYWVSGSGFPYDGWPFHVEERIRLTFDEYQQLRANYGVREHRIFLQNLDNDNQKILGNAD